MLSELARACQDVPFQFLWASRTPFRSAQMANSSGTSRAKQRGENACPFRSTARRFWHRPALRHSNSIKRKKKLLKSSRPCASWCPESKGFGLGTQKAASKKTRKRLVEAHFKYPIPRSSFLFRPLYSTHDCGGGPH